MPLPSAATLRPPRAPYGGRLLGTDGMQGTNTQQYGNQNMAGAIGENLMGLLGGKNMAADQADRTNLTAMSQLQKNQSAGTQRNAAQMGIHPGDPRYAAYQAKQAGDLQSMGSKLMGDAQQGRLNDQSRNLSTAISFNQGQQNHGMDQQRMGLDRDKFGLDKEKFGEDTRRFDQNFGEETRRFDQTFGESARRYDQDFSSSEKSKEVNTLFDIINNPLSSEGQVEAAKQRLLQTQGGLDAGTFNTPEKNAAQRQFEEIRSQLAVMNPGMSPEELDNMARERFSEIDKAAYNTLVKANGTAMPAAKAAGGGASGGMMGSKGAIADTYNTATGGIGLAKGAGHTLGEVGRGARDISNGDILGGGGRIFAAPFKGAGHAVMDVGRSAGRTGRRIKNLLPF